MFAVVPSFQWCGRCTTFAGQSSLGGLLLVGAWIPTSQMGERGAWNIVRLNNNMGYCDSRQLTSP